MTMTDQISARLALPLLAAGQAGKEVTHNEALTRLDMLVQPAVVGLGGNTPPADPRPGQCWIVGPAPTDAWAGHGDALACWTTGGWRFAGAADGLVVWNMSAGQPLAYRDGRWRDGEVVAGRLIICGVPVVGPRGGAIAEPEGGTVIDTAARQTLARILSALRQHGLIAG
jgi:hypothetical protein